MTATILSNTFEFGPYPEEPYGSDIALEAGASFDAGAQAVATAWVMVLAGLQSGSLAVITSKADLSVHTGGDRSEISRVELTPELRGLELTAHAAGLSDRILMAAGIPPRPFG